MRKSIIRCRESTKSPGEDAIRTYQKMQSDGVTPSINVVISALKMCSSLRDVRNGEKIHYDVARKGDDSNIFVANTLVDMYAKCGKISEARSVFDKMANRTIVSWNCIIMGYAQAADGEMALHLFDSMQAHGYRPDRVTVLAALKACASLAEQIDEQQRIRDQDMEDSARKRNECLERGRAIHSQVAELDVYVANALMDMYGKCGSLDDARRVFDRMPIHSVVSWNCVIMGYAQNGKGELALELYERMGDEGCEPNARTSVAALKACGSLTQKEEAKQVNGRLMKPDCLVKGKAIHSNVSRCGHHMDIFVANTLVDLYGKCGNMTEARKVFDEMTHRDVVTWNCIVMGYADNGEGELALELLARMQDEKLVVANRVSYLAALKACGCMSEKEEGKQVNGEAIKVECLIKGKAIHKGIIASGIEIDSFMECSLVDMYAKCGSMTEAELVFSKMRHRSVVSWNCMIMGYAQNGKGVLALQMYKRMLDEGLRAEVATFIAALKACGIISDLGTGKKIHERVSTAGLLSDVVVSTSLVDFYGKCGSMIDAQHVFDSIQRKVLVTWNALMMGYSRIGNTERVFDLYEKVRKEVAIQPNEVTFLALLIACNHAGLVEKGREYFKSMHLTFRIAPNIEHYTCMVDILGRSDRLDDAVTMVKNMPFRPDLVLMTTLLSACRKWTNVTIGRLAFEHSLRLDSHDSTAYVLMANIYAAAGMWEESRDIQSMRKKAGAWKIPGQSSWTDDDGAVHTFMAGNSTHQQIQDIIARLQQVLVKGKIEGYVPHLESDLHDLPDQQKESALCGHSEKLAIACALVNTTPGMDIRIVKNLRTCEDCHKATAIISKVECRVIYCRDANRFHVFKDGKCSCGDFW